MRATFQKGLEALKISSAVKNANSTEVSKAISKWKNFVCQTCEFW
jgi:hypothetical protein